MIRLSNSSERSGSGVRLGVRIASSHIGRSHHGARLLGDLTPPKEFPSHCLDGIDRSER